MLDPQSPGQSPPGRTTPGPLRVLNALLEIHVSKLLLNNYLSLKFKSFLKAAKSFLQFDFM